MIDSEDKRTFQAMFALWGAIILIFAMALATFLFFAFMTYIVIGGGVLMVLVITPFIVQSWQLRHLPVKESRREDERLRIEREKHEHSKELERERHQHELQLASERHQLELSIQHQQWQLQKHLALTRIPADAKGHYPYVIHPEQGYQALPNVNMRQLAAPRAEAEDTQADREPAIVVPTGRQLLLSGTVEQALIEGKIILGPGVDGELRYIKIKRCFTTLVSGLPSVGKTTTVFWISGQLTLIGAKLWIVDPHMYFEDEDGNKSLAAELSALSDSFVFPPCNGAIKEVIMRLKWMYNQLRTRQKPGYIVRAENTVIGIMDEFNSIADSIDPKMVIVEHEGQSLNFAQTLALVEREGRKYGLHFMLIGHKWARQDIGGDNAVRTNATTYLCHKLNDQRQADLLLGSGQGKKVLALSVGHYWITGPTWNAEPAMIATPMISAADIPLLKEIRAKRIQVIHMENVVEGTISEVLPNQFPTSSQPVPSATNNLNSISHFPQGGKQSELDFTKLAIMRELVKNHASQNEIIAEVFPGMRNTDAIAEYRKYLAALIEGIGA